MKLIRNTKKYKVVVGLVFQCTWKSWKDNTEIMVIILNSNLYVLKNASYAIFTKVHRDKSESKTHKMARTKDLTRNYNFSLIIRKFDQNSFSLKIGNFFVKFSIFLILFSNLFPCSLSKFLIFFHENVELPFNIFYGISNLKS